MQPNEFRFLNELIKSRSGIDLKEDKLYLFESRLLPIASKEGHANLSSFVSAMMRSAPNPAMIQQVVEAMTTNESMFFRDSKPFSWLKDIVFKELQQKQPGRPINVWCAASSSGQEPYSIAMTIEENRAFMGGAPVSILATDIDTQILNKASKGLYNQFESQRGLPMPLLLKYFTQVNNNNWQISDDIRRKVTFKPHNLMMNARHLGTFDIVFCRNVLIYFDEPTKIKVLQHIADVLAPGGYLFLGSAETKPLSVTAFEPHPQQPMLYRKK